MTQKSIAEKAADDIIEFVDCADWGIRGSRASIIGIIQEAIDKQTNTLRDKYGLTDKLWLVPEFNEDKRKSK